MVGCCCFNKRYSIKSNLPLMLVTWNKRDFSNDFKLGGEGGGNGDLVQ